MQAGQQPGLPTLAPNPRSPNMQNPSETRSPRSKQKNSTAACLECRRKKQKCIGGDENTPCQFCRRNGSSCKIDLTTDGRRRWHSRLREARTQQQLLAQLLDIIRSSPEDNVQELLTTIRGGASFETIETLVDAVHTGVEDDEMSTRNTADSLLTPPGEFVATAARDLELLGQSLEQHRNLLRTIFSSGHLPLDLAGKVQQLLSQDFMIDISERSRAGLSTTPDSLPTSSNFDLNMDENPPAEGSQSMSTSRSEYPDPFDSSFRPLPQGHPHGYSFASTTSLPSPSHSLTQRFKAASAEAPCMSYGSQVFSHHDSTQSSESDRQHDEDLRPSSHSPTQMLPPLQSHVPFAREDLERKLHIAEQAPAFMQPNVQNPLDRFGPRFFERKNS